MVSYEVPKPPQGFMARARDSVRLASAFMKGDKDANAKPKAAKAALVLLGITT